MQSESYNPYAMMMHPNVGMGLKNQQNEVQNPESQPNQNQRQDSNNTQSDNNRNSYESKEIKKEKQFHPPLPLEEECDYEMLEMAKQEGIQDPQLLQGRMLPETCNIINHAKLKHRSSLKLEDWSRDNYYRKQKEVLDIILKEAKLCYQNQQRVNLPYFQDTIERVHYNQLDENEFIDRFEFGSKPVIIQGVADNWPGLHSWKMNSLLQRFANSRFKIGESDSGRKLKVTLKQYIEYVLYGRDDSPLYLFESSLEEHPEAHAMQQDYQKPKYFEKNLFKLLPEEDMPPHRWFLIGPKRSGSEIHQDPLGTSAWNTSVQGHKKWILIPPGPGLHKKFMRGKHLMKKGEDDEAIQYFDFIFPRLKAAENHPGGKLPTIIECIQYPGETMFVPGGWWHAVINLDNTFAITENVCNAGNFERVWTQTRKSRKRLAYRWLKRLRKYERVMFDIALEMNRRDNFVMWRPQGPVNDDQTVSSCSSSTSSSSSQSSDDCRTIDMIRQGLPDFRESQEDKSEFKWSYDRQIWQMNKDIKNKIKLRKMQEESKNGPKSRSQSQSSGGSSNSSSSDSSSTPNGSASNSTNKSNQQMKSRSRSKSKGSKNEIQYSGGEAAGGQQINQSMRIKKIYN